MLLSSVVSASTHLVPVEGMHGSCLKCKKQDVEVVSARKDSYCRECFIIFAKSKYRRAIDAFRLDLGQGDANPRLILAVSGGMSSTVLVDLVYTAVQRTRGRYHMPVILHINDLEYYQEDSNHIANSLSYIKENYPDMDFVERSMVEVDRYMTSSVHLTPDHTTGNSHVEALDDLTSPLKECIAALPSRTSQEDVLALYRERLILETAKERDCAGILFGNSATSLAAKTLSLTAKGRGYALPWETADHALSHSGIWSIRPMKGLLRSEVRTYAQLIGVPLPSPSISTSGKPTSIDHLTQRYFENLETQFPSLVATVVRTTNKLVEPVAREKALGDCKICGMSYQEGARKWLRDITVTQPAPNPEITDESSILGGQVKEDFCYGCVVAVRGIKSEMAWPTFKVLGRGNSVQDVTNEFELQDE